MQDPSDLQPSEASKLFCTALRFQEILLPFTWESPTQVSKVWVQIDLTRNRGSPKIGQPVDRDDTGDFGQAVIRAQC
jgi:hypothetical protein